MREAFIPLAEILRGDVEIASPAEAPAQPAPAHEGNLATALFEDVEFEETFAALRRFRAAIADAVDAKVDAVLREIAVSVVARELSLSPVDVATIVSREIALGGELPVRLVAHPSECDLLSEIGCEVARDDGLRRGDVRFELRCGTIDLSLGARLERVLSMESLV